MDFENDESLSYKRNLRFENISQELFQDSDNLQFYSKYFISQHEDQHKISSLRFSEFSESQQGSFFCGLKSPDSKPFSCRREKRRQQKATASGFEKKTHKLSCSQVEKSSIQFENIDFGKIKQEIFESLVVCLLRNFNPSASKPQHLCRLNESFSIFNKILREENHDSLLIYGVSSTGKSASVDWALRNVRGYQKLNIDCLDFDSEVSFIFKLNDLLRVFFEIKTTIEMDYDQFERKSLFAMLVPFISKSNKKAILVIENAEFLIKFTAHKVIYNLAELASNSRKNVKIVLITKLPNFIKALDRREKSRLKLLPLQMLKLRSPIIEIFKQRLLHAEKQMDSEVDILLENYSPHQREKFGKILKEWQSKIFRLFCQNQPFKKQLQSLSKGIENHLNAACFSIANILHLDRIQQSPQQVLQQQLILSYKLVMNNMNSFPSKNLLQNANLDEKIFMALVYTMLTNERKPHSFNTVLRISYEFKAQKVEKSYNIYLSQMNLKKAYMKLIDKKIIYFQDGDSEQTERQIKVSMNNLDIREAIINDGQAQVEDLPYFVKQVLCL